MKDSTYAIVFFGSLFVLAGGISLVSSVITYEPSLAVKADQFMNGMNVITAGAMLVTLALLFRRGRSVER